MVGDGAATIRGPRVVVRLQVLQLDEIGPCLDGALAALKQQFRSTAQELRCDSCFMSGSETDVLQNDPARLVWSLLRVEAALARAAVLPGLEELTLAHWGLPASACNSFTSTFILLLTRLGISRLVVHECFLDGGSGTWLVERLSTIGLKSLMWRGETALTSPPVEVSRHTQHTVVAPNWRGSRSRGKAIHRGAAHLQPSFPAAEVPGSRADCARLWAGLRRGKSRVRTYGLCICIPQVIRTIHNAREYARVSVCTHVRGYGVLRTDGNGNGKPRKTRNGIEIATDYGCALHDPAALKGNSERL